MGMDVNLCGDTFETYTGVSLPEVFSEDDIEGPSVAV